MGRAEWAAVTSRHPNGDKSDDPGRLT